MNVQCHQMLPLKDIKCESLKFQNLLKATLSILAFENMPVLEIRTELRTVVVGFFVISVSIN